MKHALKFPLLHHGLLVAAALLAGCASQPDRYYTLAAPANALPPSSTSPTGNAAPVYIELAPIALPERLARPQMVVSQAGGGGGAEVKLLEKHRWTSSFENELRDALSSGITSRLGAVDVTKGSRPTDQPAWRIAVQLKQFDAVEDSRVDAGFSWTVRRSDTDRYASCTWSGSEPVGRGIDALALGAQRVTAGTAQAIARHVAALQADPAAACPGA